MRSLVLNASTQSGIEAAFVTLAEERAHVLLVSGDSFWSRNVNSWLRWPLGTLCPPSTPAASSRLLVVS